jgi:hypothetical protein
MKRKKQYHYSPDDIRQQIFDAHQKKHLEAVDEASDKVVRDMFAAFALAIMEDREDTRSEEEKAEYIQKIFKDILNIWTTAANSGQSRAHRQIAEMLKRRYGIEIGGI